MQGNDREVNPLVAREKFAVNLRNKKRKQILHESRKRTLRYLKNEEEPTITTEANMEMSCTGTSEQSDSPSLPFRSTRQLTKAIDSFEQLIPDYS